MIRLKSRSVILIHLVVLVGSLGLAYFSGQNPRIILYGLSIGLLFRFITVWLLSSYALSVEHPERYIKMLSRPPLLGEKSKPYKHQKTREMSGLFGYIAMLSTVVFMVGVLQALGGGTAFLKANILIPELSWSLLIAFIYWIEDLLGRDIIVAPRKSTPLNLGYNTTGLNFMLAAIIISSTLILLFVPVMLVLEDIMPGITGINKYGLPAEWIFLSVLALLRFGYSIGLPEQRYSTGRRLPG